MKDATGGYNTEARFERAGARAIESLLVSVPSNIAGNLVAGSVGGYLAEPGMVVGYVGGYLAVSTYVSTLAEPYMNYTVFPLFPIVTRQLKCWT